jgi:hypothetical protein
VQNLQANPALIASFFSAASVAYTND